MKEYKCRDCYDTGNATAYITEFRGRNLIHTTGYEMCTACTTEILREDLDAMRIRISALVRALQLSVEQMYAFNHKLIATTSDGSTESDRGYYTLLNADTHQRLNEIVVDTGVHLDRSFIRDVEESIHDAYGNN